MSKFEMTIKFDTIAELQQSLAKLLTEDTAAQITTVTEEVEETPTVDKSGREWDERIDSSSKKLTKDGYWARRRGLDDSEYEKILNEAITTDEPAPAPVTPPPAPVTPPPAPVTPPPAPPAPPATINDIVSHVTYMREELKIPDLNEKLDELCKSLGLSSFSDIFGVASQEQINEFYAKATGK